MADEYIVGEVDGVTEDTINFLPDVTWEDLLLAIEEEDITGGVDVMVIGKKIGSGKKTREVGASWIHLEDSEELYKVEGDPVNDTLEIVQDMFHTPELPEKIVGFIVRPT